MSTCDLNSLKIAEIEVKYSTSIKPSERVKITGSKDAADAFRTVWRQPLELKECFYAMFLNRGNKVLGTLLISEGGIAGTVVDVRSIFSAALKANTCSIILAHNHPSGNGSPSDADLRITTKIKNAGELLDIQVLDHIILLPDGYTSFADDGHL
ncbi:JAB domain-containing protein [Maribellus sediminis]|uniref:JAB domain-containing protein n=1 Tax=Maribellus sediminis TaxID=2696285 RepID=UPI001431712F|nr:JAB domain-containing protein [Maribellus sediminis]